MLTPLEGDEKLPKMTSLQLLNIKEPSHEQDARNGLYSHVLKNVRVNTSI